MNGELRAPGKLSFTKPYCGKRGSAAVDPIMPSYLWDRDEETEQSTKPKNHKEQQLFLETRNGNIRSSGKPSTPKAEKGYSQLMTPSLKCNGTYRGKIKKGLDKRGNKRSDMVLYVLQKAFYRKLHESL